MFEAFQLSDGSKPNARQRDARLHAAAPNMLAALRMLDDHFAWLVEHDEHKNADLTMQAVVRAAIAKATGAE